MITMIKENWRHGKRNRTVSARITEADRETLRNNRIPISQAVEWYIDNYLKTDLSKQHRLKELEAKLAGNREEMERELERQRKLEHEIEELKKEVAYMEKRRDLKIL